MKLTPTPLAGAFVITGEPVTDERGTFARVFSHRDFERHGLATQIAQSSISTTTLRGTLRGMHFQIAPHEETKLVRCLRGSIFDVIVDLRPDSATYRGHFAITLADVHTAVYVPAGCAHGFLTLTDDTHVLYQMDVEHEPRAARGVRWNDPVLGIAWPFEPVVMAARDAAYPLLEPA